MKVQIHTKVQKYLTRYFSLEANDTTIQDEVLAGVTTFLTMVYITVVNPSILSETGMDFGAVFVATCLAAALGSLIMGVYANYPVALAPGMGQNAFFTYGIVLGMGHTWQSGLGAVFISGIIFMIISILSLREKIINAIPKSLKLGISAGIGFFIILIALKGSHIIVAQSSTLLTLGDLSSMSSLFTLMGFAFIVGLTARGVKGALIIGILTITLLGWAMDLVVFEGIISLPPDIAPVLMKMDLSAALNGSMITVILTLLLVDIFDTAGTLIGVGTQANLLNSAGKLPRLQQALLADSTATVAGAALGTSSTTSYIESAAGIKAGGRTGLTAVVTSGLFILCLLFAPLAQSIPSFATNAALLFVGTTMIQSLKDLDWTDLTEYIPAALTAIMMPLSYSIADGLGIGFMSYVAIKIASGRKDQCSLALYLIAILFMAKFVFL